MGETKRSEDLLRAVQEAATAASLGDALAGALKEIANDFLAGVPSTFHRVGHPLVFGPPLCPLAFYVRTVSSRKGDQPSIRISGVQWRTLEVLTRMRRNSMSRYKRMALAAASAWLLLGFCSCVTREETINVLPDGSSVITVQLTADSEEELNAAAPPTAADGWKVERSTRIEDAGKTKHMLVASKHVAPHAFLPSQDAPSGPQAALELKFPTSLTVEKRPDGTYYLFRRTFDARDFAQWNHVEAREVNKNLAPLVHQKSLTRSEWEKVVRMQIELQVDKKLEVARAAFLQVTPQAPVDQWVRVNKAIQAAAQKQDIKRLVDLLQAKESPQRDKEIVEATKAWDIDATIKQSLAAQGYNEQQLTAYAEACKARDRRNEITNRINDERFCVRLQLPGQLIGSNATKIENNGTLEWQISGEQMMDRKGVDFGAGAASSRRRVPVIFRRLPRRCRCPHAWCS
jgi:hypothetical protein